MFTNAELANATTPETAVTIADYPYGFRLRCMMRVWVEYRPGKGFRYCTQTTNPKRPGTVWNKPKASTYCRVSMAIQQDDNGHLSPVALTEYSDLKEYAAFKAAHDAALSDHARASLTYWQDCKAAFDGKQAEFGLANVFDGTPEQQQECKRAAMAEMVRHHKAGTAY